MTNYLRNQRGSSLVLVMVILTVLSIFGASLLNATLWGYRMKIFDNRAKEALYISEAGLEEAYAYMGKEVENAVTYSRDVYVAGMLHNNLINDKEDWSDLSDAELKERLVPIFKEGFKKYFNDGDNRRTILSNLENSITLTEDSDRKVGANGARYHQLFVDEERSQFFDDGGAADQDTMILHLVSEVRGNYDVSTRISSSGAVGTTPTDVLECDLVIRVPEYDTPFKKHLGTYTIKHNALWDYGLETDGNLSVLGAEVTVNGNVYARGTDLDREGNPLADDNVGGIIAGGVLPIGGSVSGRLQVNGKAVTPQFLETRYSTSAAPSRITVAGDALANSLFTQGDTNSNSSIVIDGNAYVEDDTQMDAQNSRIRITQNYYGFSFGSESDNTHDKSSSIIFNQDDFGPAGSQFSIGGQSYLAGLVYINQGIKYRLIEAPQQGGIKISSEDGKYIYEPNPDAEGEDQILVEKTLPNGETVEVTVAIPVTPGKTTRGLLSEDYGTGDSMSVIGNYLGYSQVLIGESVASAYKNLGDEFFKDFVPLTLVFKKNEPDDLGNYKDMDFRDKSQYARYAQEQDARDGTGIFNLGGGLISLAKTPLFALGNYITGDRLYPQVGGIADVLEALEGFSLEYRKYTQFLGDAKLSTGTPPASLAAGWLKPIAWTEREYEENNGGHRDHFYAGSDPDKAVIIQGRDASSDVEALKSTLGDNVKIIDVPSGRLRGIMVVRGPLYVVGNLDYTGLLVSGTGITLMKGSQTFTNDSDFIHDRFFKELCVNKTKYANGVCSLFAQRSDETDLTRNYTEAEILQSGGTPEYVGSMNGVMKITGWQKTRHIQ